MCVCTYCIYVHALAQALPPNFSNSLCVRGSKKACARISDIVGASAKGGQGAGGDVSQDDGKRRGTGTATLSSMEELLKKDGNG